MTDKTTEQCDEIAKRVYDAMVWAVGIKTLPVGSLPDWQNGDIHAEQHARAVATSIIELDTQPDTPAQSPKIQRLYELVESLQGMDAVVLRDLLKAYEHRGHEIGKLHSQLDRAKGDTK